jgi:ZIP family zinc transporter
MSLGSMCSTLAGGTIGLRFRGHLHYLLSFTAGVLLGVVAFDVLPEVFELAQTHGFAVLHAMVAFVAGFLVFHALEKFILVHTAHEADYVSHHHPGVGVISAIALSGHSLMDGVAIGLGFQVSSSVGATVALAVIAHDFCDGLNTVGLMLAHGNTRRKASVLLVLDALAPVAGAASTSLFRLPPFALMLYLGFLAGFLLYIGVCDILPQAHSRASPRASSRMLWLTVLGAAFAFSVAHALA